MPCLLPRTSVRPRRPPSARLRNLFRPCATHERNCEQFSPSSEGPGLSVCDGSLASVNVAGQGLFIPLEWRSERVTREHQFEI